MGVGARSPGGAHLGEGPAHARPGKPKCDPSGSRGAPLETDSSAESHTGRGLLPLDCIRKPPFSPVLEGNVLVSATLASLAPQEWGSGARMSGGAHSGEGLAHARRRVLRHFRRFPSAKKRPISWGIRCHWTAPVKLLFCQSNGFLALGSERSFPTQVVCGDGSEKIGWAPFFRTLSERCCV